MGRASSHARWEMAAASGADAFNPTTYAKTMAHLRNDELTAVGIASVTDLKAVNPATQAEAARQPIGAADGSMDWDGAVDSLSWPLAVNNHNATKEGHLFWVVSATNASETFMSQRPGTGGTNGNRLYLKSDSSRRIIADIYITAGGNGRRFTSAIDVIPALGTPYFFYYRYDGSIGGDASVDIQVGVDGGAMASLIAGGAFSDLGAGGTMGTMPTVTGNTIIGNINNSAVAGSTFTGKFGRDWWVVNDTLNAAEVTLYKNFRVLAP